MLVCLHVSLSQLAWCFVVLSPEEVERVEMVKKEKRVIKYELVD